VHRDNVVSRVQFRARLHGRNETVRAVRAVLAVLAATAPAEPYRALTASLPAELVPPTAAATPAPSRRRFVTAVAEALYLDEPSAAFLARVVFEELNRSHPATGPARMSTTVPADLRPLLTARAEPDIRHRQLLSAWGTSAPPLHTRPTTVPRPALVSAPPPAKRIPPPGPTATKSAAKPSAAPAKKAASR
jgi:uncharacterized protein (DUF2267 family)